eukprot:gene21273-7496_t
MRSELAPHVYGDGEERRRFVPFDPRLEQRAPRSDPLGLLPMARDDGRDSGDDADVVFPRQKEVFRAFESVWDIPANRENVHMLVASAVFADTDFETIADASAHPDFQHAVARAALTYHVNASGGWTCPHPRCRQGSAHRDKMIQHLEACEFLRNDCDRQHLPSASSLVRRVQGRPFAVAA